MEKKQISELTVIGGSVINCYTAEIDGKEWKLYIREDKKPKVIWEPQCIDI